MVSAFLQGSREAGCNEESKMNPSINIGRIRKALVALRQAERELEAVVISEAGRSRTDPYRRLPRRPKRRFMRRVAK